MVYLKVNGRRWSSFARKVGGREFKNCGNPACWSSLQRTAGRVVPEMVYLRANGRAGRDQLRPDAFAAMLREPKQPAAAERAMDEARSATQRRRVHAQL